MEAADARNVGAAVKLGLLPVGKAHKAAHKPRVGELLVVEADYPRRLGAQHRVEVDADGYAAEPAHLVERFVYVRPELREAALAVDLSDDPAKLPHAL